MRLVPLVVIGALLTALVITCIFKPKRKPFRHVELPEEIDLISKDKNNPDSMIAWIENDTLQIGFKH